MARPGQGGGGKAAGDCKAARWAVRSSRRATMVRWAGNRRPAPSPACEGGLGRGQSPTRGDPHGWGGTSPHPALPRKRERVRTAPLERGLAKRRDGPSGQGRRGGEAPPPFRGQGRGQHAGRQTKGPGRNEPGKNAKNRFGHAAFWLRAASARTGVAKWDAALPRRGAIAEASGPTLPSPASGRGFSGSATRLRRTPRGTNLPPHGPR